VGSIISLLTKDVAMPVAEIPELTAKSAETQSSPWAKAVLCGLIGTTIVTLAWGCLRAYTSVLETRNLRLVVAALLWTLGILVPVYGWVSDWVLKAGFIRALPINLFVSVLGALHVLGGDWLACALAHKHLVWWDGVTLTALVITAGMPLGLYRRMVKVIDECFKDFQKYGSKADKSQR
jgi:hypothetical protein